jgi:hypothetical protein
MISAAGRVRAGTDIELSHCPEPNAPIQGRLVHRDLCPPRAHPDAMPISWSNDHADVDPRVLRPARERHRSNSDTLVGAAEMGDFLAAERPPSARRSCRCFWRGPPPTLAIATPSGRDRPGCSTGPTRYAADRRVGAHRARFERIVAARYTSSRSPIAWCRSCIPPERARR